MGIYCYTLRKNTIKATDMDVGAPIEIGVTKYAYKESRGWNDGSYNRMVGKAHAAAERARDANPNLVLVTMGDPKDYDFSREGSMMVFRCKPDMTAFYDGKAPGEHVGFIYKVGKKFEFERLPA